MNRKSRDYSLLGEVFDSVLAKKWGISKQRVAMLRQERGIPAKQKVHQESVESRARGLLGLMSDVELAKRLGVSASAIRILRVKSGIPAFRPKSVEWTREMLDLLGKISDQELAERFNLFAESQSRRHAIEIVSRKRNSLGIPPWKSHRWTSASLAKLGNVSDGELAKEIGVTVSAVFLKRRRLKVPPFKQKKSA
jgi:transcriptional regulator with XRE-family HTH domain